MTALVFVLGLAAAGFLFFTRPSPEQWYLWDGMTIYVGLFILVLATASVWAIASRNWRSISAAVVLCGNFAISHYGWTAGDPVLTQAVLDSATAIYFILIGGTRWEFAIGIVMLASVAAAGAAWMDLIPGPNERAYTFLAWSYPDLTSLAGHLASIILGLGAGDWGRRVRSGMRHRLPWLGHYPSLAMMAPRAREAA